MRANVTVTATELRSLQLFSAVPGGESGVVYLSTAFGSGGAFGVTADTPDELRAAAVHLEHLAADAEGLLAARATS